MPNMRQKICYRRNSARRSTRHNLNQALGRDNGRMHSMRSITAEQQTSLVGMLQMLLRVPRSYTSAMD